MLGKDEMPGLSPIAVPMQEDTLAICRQAGGSAKIGVTRLSKAWKARDEMSEVMDVGEVKAGSSFPLRFEMNFSQPPDWEQTQAWIVVKLRNHEAEEGVAVLQVEGSTATLLPADETKDFVDSLFRNMPE